ncbi:MAG: rhodanese-like domain-containing protein [Acetobacteraceae bacterium]|nr:rhodanese-like domain-containing protein [Acetobacteraceae bacterium]
MTDVPNVTPAEAFEALRRDPDAELVDVRTAPELLFVGFPDLGGLGKDLHTVEWQQFPAMGVNPAFIEELRARGLGPGKKLYFLCRSGARSLAAGRLAVQAGQAAAFNVADGFEGPLDTAGHRGTNAGWKASGLPWKQR